MLIASADIGGPGLVDVELRGPRVSLVRPAAGRDAARGRGPVVDAAGRALLPGLHDHHVHLRAWAAAAGSVPAGPPEVHDAVELSRRLSAASPAGGGWVRAVGYHESVAGPLDRRVLDRWVPDIPLRVQHRSGAMWVVNSRGARLLGLEGADHPGIERDGEGRPTGRLFRMDSWLAGRWDGPPVDLAEVSRRAAARGVTGFTEAGPGLTPEDLEYFAGEAAGGRLVQHLHLMWSPDPGLPDPGLLDRRPGGPGLLTAGPVKFLLDDVDLPVPDELADRFRAAHRAGLGVAVHCVTRAQLVVTLAALEEAGAGPAPARIEHGAVIPAETIPRLRSLRATVVTNPSFIPLRGDRYLVEVDPGDLPHLYRAATLTASGVALSAGTDAPFGDPDPWLSVRAAAERLSASAAPVGPGERVGRRTALEWFLGHPERPERPRRVEAGAPADLCLLGAPLSEVLAHPGDVPVAMTLVAGAVVHGGDA